MATEQGRSTTSARRVVVAALGAVVLAASVALQLVFAFALSLCGLAETTPSPTTWCTLSTGTQDALVAIPIVLSIASYAYTVWKARYAPVLIGGPLLTVLWIAVLLAVLTS